MKTKFNYARIRSFVFFAFLVSVQSFVCGQKNDKLELDPKVRTGRLKNGFTYYILKNTEPKNRAELRLVVKAGSVLETDKEQGLAHFVEHMNFNGTKKFPKNELVNFLEQSGIKFGADLNAYTSFDETVYMLPVPTDTVKKLGKFVSVLAEWAQNATFDVQEIDKERGVVLEESRLGKGVNRRVIDKMIPILFEGSAYAHRLPIGLDSIIQNASYETVKGFYKKWYVPELQSFVAVGDFDVDQMEEWVKQYFSTLKSPPNRSHRIAPTIPLKKQTKGLVITDAEQPYSILQIYYPKVKTSQLKFSDRKEAILNALFNQMINQRLEELLHQSDPPFQFGSIRFGQFIGKLDATSMIIVPKGNEVVRAIKATLTEKQRAERFGFVVDELKRAKDVYKISVEKQYNEREKTHSKTFVDELVSGFLEEEPMTSIEFDYWFVNKYLDGISLEEVNAHAKTLLSLGGGVATLIASEKEKAQLPTEDRLIELLQEPIDGIVAYHSENLPELLVTQLPPAGELVEDKSEDLGISKWTFRNGTVVYALPTTFKNDEILIKAQSKGGLSAIGDADYYNGLLAGNLVGISGSGELTASQLEKFLAGKIANVRANIGDISESVSASTTQKDVKYAFEQIYNIYQATKLDTATVTGFLTNQISYLENFAKSAPPEKYYRDTLQAVRGNYNFRAMPIQAEDLKKVNPDRSLGIFKEKFNHPSDFVFIVIGNFDTKYMKELFASYVASIPNTSGKSKETFKDLKIEPSPLAVEKMVYKGKEDKALVSLFFSGAYEYSEQEKEGIESLGNILSIKLTEILREQESGVYSPRVQASAIELPASRYEFEISFGCAPANVERLIALSLAEVEKIKKEGATLVDIEKYRNNEKLSFETALKTNGFWLSEISERVFSGKDLGDIRKRLDVVNAITPAGTQVIARKYLHPETIKKVILLPEKK